MLYGKTHKGIVMVMLTAILFMVIPARIYAENETASVSGSEIPGTKPTEESLSLPVEMPETNSVEDQETLSAAILKVLSVELPAINENEESLFDFILDPQGLITRTDAIRYGGGMVEEGATLYFRNRVGEYDFSQYSDWLTVTNRGTMPVRIRVEAKLEGVETVGISTDGSFAEQKNCCMYMAVMDSYGNICPFIEDEEGGITAKLESVVSENYSFRLTGACNPDTEWLDLSIRPVVTITWTVVDAERE